VGAAFLVKQVAALHGLVYVIAVLLVRGGLVDSNPGLSLRAKFVDLSALALGFGSTLLLAAGVLWLQGAGSSAWEDIVTYGSALATIKVPEPHAPSKLIRWFTGNADPEGILPPPFGKTQYLVWWGTGSWPVWVAAVPCLAWLAEGSWSSRTSRLVVAFTLCCWVQVALPGLFWQHYYLLPTPGLALVVSSVIVASVSMVFGSFRPLRIGRILIGLIVALVLTDCVVATTWLQVRDYLMVSPEALTTRFKGGRQWVVLRAMGRELARRSAAWEQPTLYVWGWQSPLFIYSGLDGPSRHFFADPLLEDYAKGFHRGDPRVEPRVKRIIEDLIANPPSMTLVAYPPFPELLRFLQAHSTLVRVDAMGETLPIYVDRSGLVKFEAIGRSAGR
jgi:hypothetical protein